tara:strand:+ start:20085 stop:21143 length:1059 start_codon:yes stop_codon:yes gene_type:complete
MVNKKFSKNVVPLILYESINRSTLPIIKYTSSKKNNLPNNNDFFPISIREYIKSHFSYNVICTSVIGNLKVNINIAIFENDSINIKDIVSKMLTWLTICYNKGCNVNTLDIYFYPTPILKELPKSKSIIIGSKHVNSAYTNRCKTNGNIVLYRNEEWFKVFIHETFHTFGLECDDHFNDNIRNVINELYSLDENILFGEAYAEFWARIVNLCFYCYLNSKNKDNYLKLYFSNLNSEVKFSLYQKNKILNFMGLNYENLSNNKFAQKHKYKEGSNVFSYYILTSLLLFNNNEFFKICYKYNDNIFNCKYVTYKYFKDLITKKYRNISNILIEKNDLIQFKYPEKSTRMSYLNV